MSWKVVLTNLGFLHDAVQVLHAEGDIFHTVAVAVKRGNRQIVKIIQLR